MSYQQTAPDRPPAEAHRGLRLLALAAVAAGLLVLAAAAFALSYPGIRAVALSAGVSPRLARIYPLIFDAMLVVACAAVLSLRGAGVRSRLYAWVSMLALLASAAGADTVHATGTRMPHKPAAAAAAIIPWALVLIGFGLLLCLLRQAGLRRAALAAMPPRAFQERSGHVEVRASIRELIGGPAAAPGAPDRQGTGPDPDRAIDTEPGYDDPASDESLAWLSHTRDEQPAGNGRGPGEAPGTDRAESGFGPAPAMPLEGGRAAGSQSAPGPDQAEDAFLGLVEARPQAPPASPVPPQPRPAPEAGDQPRPGAAPGPEAAPGSEEAPGAETRTGPRPTSEGPDAATGTAPEADPPPETAGGPTAAAQFDRMRSSPAPPEE